MEMQPHDHTRNGQANETGLVESNKHLQIHNHFFFNLLTLSVSVIAFSKAFQA